MRLVGQWREIVQSLPDDWEDAGFVLTVEDETHAERAAALLGPINAGRRGKQLHFFAGTRGTGPSPEMIRRLLRRLDEEEIAGTLELVSSSRLAPTPEEQEPEPSPPFAERWDELVAGLPEDWSDLYAEIEFTSTDFLERAALLLAPLNPSRIDERAAFRVRVARRFGYGASAQMARRCLERLDSEEISGEVRILWAVSDTDPVDTQGPVWYVAGRAV